MTIQPTCLDCNERMEKGFVPDASYMVVLQAQWHPGTPEDARFLGFKPFTLMGKEVPAIKHDASHMHPITAYRCSKCGLLKFFAIDGES